MKHVKVTDTQIMQWIREGHTDKLSKHINHPEFIKLREYRLKHLFWDSLFLETNGESMAWAIQQEPEMMRMYQFERHDLKLWRHMLLSCSGKNAFSLLKVAPPGVQALDGFECMSGLYSASMQPRFPDVESITATLRFFKEGASSERLGGFYQHYKERFGFMGLMLMSDETIWSKHATMITQIAHEAKHKYPIDFLAGCCVLKFNQTQLEKQMLVDGDDFDSDLRDIASYTQRLKHMLTLYAKWGSDKTAFETAVESIVSLNSSLHTSTHDVWIDLHQHMVTLQHTQNDPVFECGPTLFHQELGL